MSPLTHVINLCIEYSIYPEIWKITKIVPVPKNENQDEIKNHRPVALQPIPAKIFESVVHRQLFGQVSHHITPHQHGFYASRSVLTNLVNFTEAVRAELDKGLQVDAVYTDFAKAFDKVNHGLLLQKMGALGFSERLIQFFSSYLKNRQQYVVYRGYKSDNFWCPSGVPQGSNLGPFLFLIFINDIVDMVTSSSILLYADDIKLFRPVRGTNDIEALQRDLDKMALWSNNNRLPFNVEKCEKITFTRKMKNELHTSYKINQTTLKNTELIKNLGVFIDRKMTFDPHINQLISKVKRNMGFILRNSRNFKNIGTFKSLYYAFMRSHLECTALVWNPASKKQIEALESIQKRFLRLIYHRIFQYYPLDIGYKELLLGFEVDSLEDRRKISLLDFLYSVLHGSDSKLLHKIGLRVPRLHARLKETFHIERTRTELLKNSVLNRACRLYNDIEDAQIDILAQAKLDFRRTVRDVILCNQQGSYV